MVNWVYLGRICDLSGEERDRVVGYLAPDDSWEWEVTPMGEPGLAARLEAVRSVYSDAGSTTEHMGQVAWDHTAAKKAAHVACVGAHVDAAIRSSWLRGSESRRTRPCRLGTLGAQSTTTDKIQLLQCRQMEGHAIGQR
ncbi:hypothetical protein ANOM_009998 [Aspergillus nomiae NRRL 13137]|uniref:Uncharacterized protein n=1 Tax=Aspergillus nomiae NRRL (strain ATCC 15546 / NRRL 13137 / CBS 260.88 / M93) TaxID=1509407 RepID=A0A0L1IPR7_ASPN3|nr:uncharacterized protein ANOM_009998 [Aspergillus nomiae NRRL 13137]KNG81502.1 hypothetical protein ANOM_009998 [Aspergillus nomiae NRRL 13137]